ncbi:coiled-coil domain-containing protein 102B isoform X1 [Anas acuta]|uniref:coiled-coil domain-containing protein 102B isoform X1 n=1 Tax=Anas acuta TaxID=28680 RepID=UPI0035C8EC73
MNQNMNIGSFQKIMEEMQVFRTQPRQPYKSAEVRQPDGNMCNSNLPSQHFYPYSSNYTCMHMNYSSDLEIFEAVKIRELEEVKARAAQMEKTMRWWSDCTANWREKWSKVRAERNKAREEARQLRIKLDNVVKEMSMLKKLNQDLVSEKENLENVTTWKTECSCSEIYHIKQDLNQLTFPEQEPVKELSKTNTIPVADDTKKDVEIIKDPLRSNQNKKTTLKHSDSFPCGIASIYLEEPKKSLDNIAQTSENGLIHVSVLHLHLAELQKILQKERERNVFLEKEVERTANELSLWKQKYEELRQSKLESLNQVERLKLENTSEWGKRERLEGEKQNLEEESRTLKLQVKEIQRLLEMKNKATPIKLSCDHQNTQSKLLVKNKVKEREENELKIWDQTKFFVCCWRLHQDSE